MGEAVTVWLWDDTTKVFRKALCDISGKLIISDADPFEIVQDTPEDLKHVPHAQVTGDGVYKPLQLDASDYLMVAIKALPSLNDITDVNVPAPSDQQGIEWDTATSKWILVNFIRHALLTTQGDIVVRGASVPGRFAKPTAGKFLKATATGYEGADPAYTKEFFAPIAGAVADIYGVHSGLTLDAEDEIASAEFYVPDDFSTIIEAHIVLQSVATQGAADYDIYSSYGAAGGDLLSHQENDTTSTYSVVAGDIYELDCSGILSSLAAGDYVGLKIIKKVAIGTEAWVKIVGVHFKYS